MLAVVQGPSPHGEQCIMCTTPSASMHANGQKGEHKERKSEARRVGGNNEYHGFDTRLKIYFLRDCSTQPCLAPWINDVSRGLGRLTTNNRPAANSAECAPLSGWLTGLSRGVDKGGGGGQRTTFYGTLCSPKGKSRHWRWSLPPPLTQTCERALAAPCKRAGAGGLLCLAAAGLATIANLPGKTTVLCPLFSEGGGRCRSKCSARCTHASPFGHLPVAGLRLPCRALPIPNGFCYRPLA